MNMVTTTKKLALVAGILGVSALGFLAPSASARPGNDNPGLHRGQTKVTRQTTVVRTQPVVRTRTVVQRRTTVQHRTTYRNPATTRPSTYRGRVLSVSNGRIALDVGGNIYTVILSGGLPRGTSRGDYVRVTGVRNGGSIRNGRVYMVRNS